MTTASTSVLTTQDELDRFEHDVRAHLVPSYNMNDARYLLRQLRASEPRDNLRDPFLYAIAATVSNDDLWNRLVQIRGGESVQVLAFADKIARLLRSCSGMGEELADKVMAAARGEIELP